MGRGIRSHGSFIVLALLAVVASGERRVAVGGATARAQRLVSPASPQASSPPTPSSSPPRGRIAASRRGRVQRLAALAVAAAGARGARAQEYQVLSPQEVYQQVDEDGNGLVDKNELKHVLFPGYHVGKAITPTALTFADTVFMISDANKDGFLDQDEFRFMNYLSHDSSEANMWKLLDKLEDVFTVGALHGFDPDLALLSVFAVTTDAEDGMTPEEVVDLAKPFMEPGGPLDDMPPMATRWALDFVHSADLDGSGTLEIEEINFLRLIVRNMLIGSAQSQSPHDPYDDDDFFFTDDYLGSADEYFDPYFDGGEYVGGFGTFDQNKDGKIEWEEWVRHFRVDEEVDEESAKMARALFDGADGDGDGVITPEELAEFLVIEPLGDLSSLFAGSASELESEEENEKVEAE